ncbi:MAG: hypothetical protein JWP64_3651, partial [Pseudonocardia sp.]
MSGSIAAVDPVTTTDPKFGRCGTATATAFITPMRSTSVASTKSIGSGSPMAIGRMPALATTTSSLPSS